MPIVSCRSSACAIASLVPTPSVELASTGLRVLGEVEAGTARRNRRGRRSVSGRSVRLTAAFISSTARSPAAMSTPAAA